MATKKSARIPSLLPKKTFSRKLLKNLFGGSIRRSADPLARKDVRSTLRDAGILSYLDPTVKGERTLRGSTLSRDEAVDMLRKIRETLQKNLQERGYGMKERGVYSGKTEKSIIRGALRESRDEEVAASERDTEEREELQTRRVRARRREAVRRELGLGSIEKLAKEKESRRQEFEHRIESMREKPKESPGAHADSTNDSPKPEAPGGPGAASRVLGVKPVLPRHVGEEGDAETDDASFAGREVTDERKEETPQETAEGGHGTAPPSSPGASEDAPSGEDIEKDLPL